MNLYLFPCFLVRYHDHWLAHNGNNIRLYHYDLPLRATTINTTGHLSRVTNFTIQNLRGDRRHLSANSKRPCLGTNVPSGTIDLNGDASGKVVQLVNDEDDWQGGYKKLDGSFYSNRLRGNDGLTRMKYRFDYEECMGWEWDVVATAMTSQGLKTAKCHWRVLVSDHNDSPYWTEPLLHGDRYVRVTTRRHLTYSHESIRVL